MSKELFIKLSEELGRDPTDDEMADEMSRAIDAMSSEIDGLSEEMKQKGEFFVLSPNEAKKNFDALMKFQYGDTEESEKAWDELKEGKK